MSSVDDPAHSVFEENKTFTNLDRGLGCRHITDRGVDSVNYIKHLIMASIPVVISPITKNCY